MNPATLPVNKDFCIFCPQPDGTVPAGDVAAEDELGYLTQSGRPVDGELVLEEGHWLLVPRLHVATRSEMPKGWDETEWYLIQNIPGFGPDEARWPPHVVYYLYGRQVGQTLYHRHGHVRVGENGVELKLGTP